MLQSLCTVTLPPRPVLLRSPGIEPGHNMISLASRGMLGEVEVLSYYAQVRRVLERPWVDP